MVSVVQSPFIVLYVHVHIPNLMLKHMCSLQLFLYFLKVKLFFSSFFTLYLINCDYIECKLITSGVMMTSTQTKCKNTVQSLQPTTGCVRTVRGNYINLKVSWKD